MITAVSSGSRCGIALGNAYRSFSILTRCGLRALHSTVSSNSNGRLVKCACPAMTGRATQKHVEVASTMSCSALEWTLWNSARPRTCVARALGRRVNASRVVVPADIAHEVDSSLYRLNRLQQPCRYLDRGNVRFLWTRLKAKSLHDCRCGGSHKLCGVPIVRPCAIEQTTGS